MRHARRGERNAVRRLTAHVLAAASLMAVLAACTPTSATAPLVVDSAGDAPDRAPGDGTCSGSQRCTLRAAIEEANASQGPDRIHFRIGGGAPGDLAVIAPSRPLPAVTDRLVIDGFTQPGARPNAAVAPAPLTHVIAVQLLGPGLASFDGVVFGPGSADSELRGLSIGGFDRAVKAGDDRIRITGNHIGVDPTGMTPVPNLACGVSQAADDSDDVRVGGTAPADRNLISANGTCGISPNTGSDRWVIQGNYLGTDAAGTAALPNLSGGALSLDNSDDHLIGGTEPGAANLISGNETFGIAPHGSHGSRILGNLIGTDHTGTRPLPNQVGVGVAEETSVVLGGAGPGEGNVIAHNTWMDVSVGGDGSVITGNRIGVLADGSVARPGASVGVAFGLAASGNLIGGDGPGAGNQIAGQGTGVLIMSMFGLAPADNAIVGNSLHSHAHLAIDLARDTDGDLAPDQFVGPDPAGAGPDPAGPNGQQPAPVITGLERSGRGVELDLIAPPTLRDAPVRIDLYFSSATGAGGSRQGGVPLGSILSEPGETGRFHLPWPGDHPDPGAGRISATATVIGGLAPGGLGSTSELSAGWALPAPHS